MGKKSDLKNIFESYYNNVVLGEAVKPEEVDSAPRQLTPEQQTAVQNLMNTKGYNRGRAELVVLRGQDVKSTAATQQPVQPTQPVKPVQQTTQPVQQTTQPVQQPVKPVQPAQQATTNPYGMVDDAQAEQKMQQQYGYNPSLQNKTQPVATTQETDEFGDDEGEVVSQEVIGSRPAYTATNGTQNFNGTRITSGPVVGSDEEFEQDEQEDADSKSDDEGEVESKKKIGSYPVGAAGKFEFDGTTITAGPVVEKIKISKFLKHLSEKNYSSAHKYLKAILNTKINNIVSERIDKNFK